MDSLDVRAKNAKQTKTTTTMYYTITRERGFNGWKKERATRSGIRARVPFGHDRIFLSHRHNRRRMMRFLLLVFFCFVSKREICANFPCKQNCLLYVM